VRVLGDSNTGKDKSETVNQPKTHRKPENEIDQIETVRRRKRGANSTEEGESEKKLK